MSFYPWIWHIFPCKNTINLNIWDTCTTTWTKKIQRDITGIPRNSMLVYTQ